jgi:hypothetical protein
LLSSTDSRAEIHAAEGGGGRLMQSCPLHGEFPVKLPISGLGQAGWHTGSTAQWRGGQVNRDQLIMATAVWDLSCLQFGNNPTNIEAVLLKEQLAEIPTAFYLIL